MPAGERLQWYAQHFDMVEVNSTFYSAPEPRMVERWCAATPDDFTFDVKLHQLFSFHSTPAKLLPPDLQNRVETDARTSNRHQRCRRRCSKLFCARWQSFVVQEKWA